MFKYQNIAFFNLALPLAVTTTFLLIVLSSCDLSFSLLKSLDGPDGKSLSLNPGQATLLASQELQFTTLGGLPPYKYTIVSGEGTIDGDGTYVAPNTLGKTLIEVSDAMGTLVQAQVETSQSITSSETVDYGEILLTNTGTFNGGSPLSGSLSFKNLTPLSGVSDISWKIYSSYDTILGGGDLLVDGGTIPPLSSLASVSIDFSGIWPNPVSDSEIYLIGEITSPDDSLNSNNQNSLGQTITTAPGSNIDYRVSNITNSPATALVNTAMGQSFNYINDGADLGTQNLQWQLYLSTDSIYDETDPLIDTGILPPLPGSTNSSPLMMGGNWPAGGGIYYIIVKLFSSEENNPANDISVSAPFTIGSGAGEVDYLIGSVSRDYPNVTSNSICAETFSITNVGGTNGSTGIAWTAYASIDSIIDGGDDIIKSGTLSPIDASTTVVNLPINGPWPTAAGTYNLLIRIDSVDETLDSNNNGSANTFNIKSPPDYEIQDLLFQNSGVPLNPLSDQGIYSFTIRELSGNSGSQPILWKAYASTDIALDVNDYLIESGVISPLSGSSIETNISFSSGSWPTQGSRYNLIITLAADDDDNGTNNQIVSSSRVFVPEIYNEGVEDNSSAGPTAIALANVSDLAPQMDGGSLDKYELFEVNGNIEISSKFGYDTYRIITGPGVTKLELLGSWETGFNELDLFIWDEASNQESSQDWNVDREPLFPSSPAVFIVNPSTVYYIGVNFMRNLLVETPYTLTLWARD